MLTVVPHLVVRTNQTTDSDSEVKQLVVLNLRDRLVHTRKEGGHIGKISKKVLEFNLNI